MKVVLITGSAHTKGTTAMMAEQFVKGATEAGHEVFRFDAAFKNVHPCIACERCHMTDNGCVFKDDMEVLNPEIIHADAVVFVSPIYYYDMNAQIKSVIDRFYANDAAMHDDRKVAWITTMADDTLKSADGANVSFTNMSNFFGWNIVGHINCQATWTVDDLAKTDYPNQAYGLGKAL